jgi:hypothetical protein
MISDHSIMSNWKHLLSASLIRQLAFTHALRSLKSFLLAFMQSISVSSHDDDAMFVIVHFNYMSMVSREIYEIKSSNILRMEEGSSLQVPECRNRSDFVYWNRFDFVHMSKAQIRRLVVSRGTSCLRPRVSKPSSGNSSAGCG